MTRPYFIIESAHRGAYVGGEFGWPTKGPRRWMPRFRWSILRTHAEVRSYLTREAAERELTKVRAAAPSAKAYVHEMFARERA